jgi:multidrug efflux pump subunit AcrA (membrane-fusion protein)
MTMKKNERLKAYSTIYREGRKSNIKYWFYGIISSLGIILFLPWTQNIKTNGDITTRFQEQRPQEINSPIPGKIVKWFVKEGDYVKKGDTILEISEIKEDYLDPNLVGRTKEQITAKRGAIVYYEGKVESIRSQIAALNQSKKLKLQQLDNKFDQTENKLIAEKAELSAAENEYQLAKDQYERQQKMFNEGLVSQTQLQQRNTAFQNALAKKIVAENKLAQTKQELTIISIEKNSVQQDYTEKVSKAQGDQFQSYSQIAVGQGDVAKLENQVSNYMIRNGMYIITAPQDGQIVQAKKSGIGEILKDGEHIALIVPTKINYAVEMFVRPIDMPLIDLGQKVRLIFDGFPTIVFSGWPERSYGTFGGKVVAFENTISPNGLFRVLVAEDTTDRPWPEQLRIGSGAQGIALLKDVPIWYELWRNINGFPPNYYKTDNQGYKDKRNNAY